jgi:hypothetical protein
VRRRRCGGESRALWTNLPVRAAVVAAKIENLRPQVTPQRGRREARDGDAGLVVGEDDFDAAGEADGEVVQEREQGRE